MKKFFIFLLPIFLYSQELDIRDFMVDLHSKTGGGATQKIVMDLKIEGRDVNDESYKVIDALNIIVGSFYAQDLLTSKGKEGLKKMLISYTKKEYNIDIDAVYIGSLKFEKDLKVDELIEVLKREFQK